MSGIEIPKITGEWQLLFRPERCGNYINDHSIIKDRDGKWHLFGITSMEGIPSYERYFVHAVSENGLYGSVMEEKGRVIDDGTRAWAPCVIGNDDKYYMYYGPSLTKMAVSADLTEWMGYEINMIGAPPMACNRDHFVMKLNDYTWIMYVSGVKDGYGAVACLVSNDLCSWRFVQYALTSDGNAPLRPAWGAFESPYVVKRGDMYYLFVTYTDCNIENYQNTLVFASQKPYDFGNYNGDNHKDMVVAQLHAHACEVIKDGEDYYITTCGWNGKGIPIEGAAAIARLEWV